MHKDNALQSQSCCAVSCCGYAMISANTQRNNHVINTSKRRFGVMITCLLCFVFAEIVMGWFIHDVLCPRQRWRLAKRWLNHYSDVMMGAMAFQTESPASTLFTQPFIQAQIKKNIKVPRHWPFVWRIHRSPVKSPHKWPVTRKMFPFHDVIMTSSRTPIETVSPEGTFCDTVQFPSGAGDMELI